MNETKHTPGPWHVASRGESGTQQLPIFANGKIIAAIRDEGSLGDARLIAAAPDLLAALQAITTWITGCDTSADTWGEQTGHIRRSIELAHEAIRKATGKEQGT